MFDKKFDLNKKIAFVLFFIVLFIFVVFLLKLQIFKDNPIESSLENSVLVQNQSFSLSDEEVYSLIKESSFEFNLYKWYSYYLLINGNCERGLNLVNNYPISNLEDNFSLFIGVRDSTKLLCDIREVYSDDDFTFSDVCSFCGISSSSFYNLDENHNLIGDEINDLNHLKKKFFSNPFNVEANYILGEFYLCESKSSESKYHFKIVSSLLASIPKTLFSEESFESPLFTITNYLKRENYSSESQESVFNEIC